MGKEMHGGNTPKAYLFRAVADAVSLANRSLSVWRLKIVPKSDLRTRFVGNAPIDWHILVTNINIAYPAMPPITIEDAQSCKTVEDLMLLLEERESYLAGVRAVEGDHTPNPNPVTNPVSPRQAYACSTMVAQFKGFNPDAVEGFARYLSNRPEDRALMISKLQEMLAAIRQSSGEQPEVTVVPLRQVDETNN